MPVFTSKKALSDEGLSSEARLGERKTSYLGAECLSLRLSPSAKSTSLVRGRLSKAPATAGTPLKTAPSKRELSAAKLLTKGVLSLYAKKHHPAGWCFFAYKDKTPLVSSFAADSSLFEGAVFSGVPAVAGALDSLPLTREVDFAEGERRRERHSAPRYEVFLSPNLASLDSPSSDRAFFDVKTGINEHLCQYAEWRTAQYQ